MTQQQKKTRHFGLICDDYGHNFLLIADYMYIHGKPFIFPIHYIFISGNNKIDACHFQYSLIFALCFSTLQTSKAHQ